MVLRRGMLLAGMGIVIGVVGSIATGGLLSGVFQSQARRVTACGRYALAVPTLARRHAARRVRPGAARGTNRSAARARQD